MPKTWGGRSEFFYSGSVLTGTTITFGKGFQTKISAQDYQHLRRYFKDRIVNIGTSRTDPPTESLGWWMQKNITRLAVACYVGPILILEGYAVRVGKHEIKIIK